MKKLLTAVTFALAPAGALADTAAQPGDCVVLLHGLARTEVSMLVMQAALEASGYYVVNSGYPSTAGSVSALAGGWVGPAVAECEGRGRVHFVTHSMGGILLRLWLTQHRPKNLGRTVMLAPPNKGSELVDKLGTVPGFSRLNGPAGMELGTGPRSLPNRLPPVDFPLGVIAGSRSLNPLYSALIGAENDGKVSVESTKVAGMAAHLTLPVTHTFLMNSPLVIVQVLNFLHHGSFEPNLDFLEASRRLAALGTEALKGE
ncbi:esterase/lipase family protein [Falsigemmobacter faecalis]|uniref:esterase/lipase family protein n=1 Tax=Falsigemmobacter faecalis TaxID=2488730 RepID=UPI001F3BC108|nr:alpha/beta hydrolase [Falsigemmobacter faecalis]